jgi:PTH1 family peptidyl-tRNA hydrolase
MRSVPKLVVGLGNPGPKYESTRHNAGFAVVDRIAEREGVLFRSGRDLEGFGAPVELELALVPRYGERTWLVKPMDFMNLSGAVVSSVLAWSGTDPAELLVVYDDLDLPLGKLRIRPRGGPGTHNGMRSIVDSLATDAFPRLRVGIGPARTDAARHVLERFTEEEEATIRVAVEEAADAISAWLESGDLDACMTRFHSRWNQGETGSEVPDGPHP